MEKSKTCILVFFVLGIVLLHCQEKRDYQEGFQERILLQYLLEEPPPENQCQNYFQTLSDCLAQSGNPQTPTDAINLARLLHLSLAGNAPSGTNLDEVCGEVLETSFFRQFTERARSCFLGCQTEDWKNKNQAGACNQEYSDLYNSRTQSDLATTCLRKCSQINNTEEF